jgi:hypothetical protein
MTLLFIQIFEGPHIERFATGPAALLRTLQAREQNSYKMPKDKEKELSQFYPNVKYS